MPIIDKKTSCFISTGATAFPYFSWHSYVNIRISFSQAKHAFSCLKGKPRCYFIILPSIDTNATYSYLGTDLQIPVDNNWVLLVHVSDTPASLVYDLQDLVGWKWLAISLIQNLDHLPTFHHQKRRLSVNYSHCTSQNFKPTPTTHMTQDMLMKKSNSKYSYTNVPKAMRFHSVKGAFHT